MIDTPHHLRKSKLSLSVDTRTNDEVIVPKPVKMLTSPLKSKVPSIWTPTHAKTSAKTNLSSLFNATLGTSSKPSPTTTDTAHIPNLSPSNNLEVLAGLEIQSILFQASLPQEASKPAPATLLVSTPTRAMPKVLSTPTKPAPTTHFDTGDTEPMFDVEIDDVILNRTGARNFAFGMDDDYDFHDDVEDSMDAVYDNMSQHPSQMHCMTPPVRTENHIYLDARFCSDQHWHHMTHSPSADADGAELGLVFNFSPPLCSSH